MRKRSLERLEAGPVVQNAASSPIEVKILPKPARVCLTMILKNEAHVIARSLASVKPLIDRYVICDTGSTDGTQDAVKKALEGVPGEVIDIPWEGFGLSRTRGLTRAIETCEAPGDEYAMVLDADEMIVSPPDKSTAFAKRLEAYSIQMTMAGASWPQNRFFRLRTPQNVSQSWRYLGVRHEFPTCDGNWQTETIPNISLATSRDGARSNMSAKEKFGGDALAIEEALRTEKDASLRMRYVFYLAQSWRDAGSRGGGAEDDLAAKYYLERADMGAGYNWEETYCALVEAGRALNRRGKGDEAAKIFWRAYWHWPARIEAARELATMFKYRTDTNPKHGTLFVEA